MIKKAKSAKNEKNDLEKNVSPEKESKNDSKNDSVVHEKSMLNESELAQDPNQSVINQSHNISVNQSLNQSVASCLICYEKLPDAVLMECGHGGN